MKDDDTKHEKFIESARHQMAIALAAYYPILQTLAPFISGYAPPTGHTGYVLEPSDPASDPILMPSRFDAKERKSFQLDEMTEVEIKLRTAHCHEYLGKLRKALGVRSWLTRHSTKFNGTNRTTRAQEVMNRAETSVKEAAHAYERSHAHLLQLCDATDLGGLKNLEKDDLQLLSSWLEGDHYKKSSSLDNRQSKKLPWIWTIGQEESDPEHSQLNAEGS